MGKQTQAQSRPKQNKRFWNFVPGEENQPPELVLYGDISSSTWWGDEITPKQFSDDLKALGDVSEIVVRINSGGGDVFAAFAIYTQLKDHKARITVKIDGWAGSAATIIAMAGDVILIPAAGAFMVHDPAMGVYGYYRAGEFTKLAEELQVIKNCIVNAYALKTGKDKEEISAIMEAATWYDGETAVENGFCDELMFEEVQTEVENAAKIIVNSVSMDISGFRNIPASLLNSRPTTGGGGCFSNIQTPNNQKEESQTMEIKTVDELKAAYPAFAKQIADDAAAAERKRIKDIEEAALPGFEDIVQNAKFESPVAAADVSMQIIAKMKAQGQQYLNDRGTDVENSGISGVGNEDRGAAGGEQVNPYDAAIDKLFPKTK